MLKKVILKNFKSNGKTYLLFYICNILASAELFVFWGLNDIVKDAVSDKVTAAALKTDFMIAAGVVAFITACIMCFSMKCYIQLRIRDYTAFITLGMKKRTTYLLLLSEYSAGCISALVLGLLLGSGALLGTQWALSRAYPEFLEMKRVSPYIYRDAAGVSLLMMAAVFLILLVWMDGRDLSALMNQEARNEKRPVSKKWLLMVAAGIGGLVLGEVLFQASDLTYVYSHIVWALGLFLIVAFGTSFVLNGLKKKEGVYFRHVISLNQLYSRYQNNLFILAVLLTIHFFALSYLAVQIADILPLDKYRENYPYDVMWIAREGDMGFGEEVAEKYGGELTGIPMVRAATSYDAQHIGISASSYERLTGKKCELKGREIIVEIEDSDCPEESKIKEKDYLDVYGTLFVGADAMDISSPAAMAESEKEAAFSIKEIFSSCIVGQYSIDTWHENIIVFSDEYFEGQWKEVCKNAGEASSLGLFCFPKRTHDKAFEELREYDRKNGIQNKNASQMEESLYGTEEFLSGQRMRSVFSLCSKLFLAASLLFVAFFTAGLKVLTELSAFQKRYEFLRCMGMKRRQRRKSIASEVRLLYRISTGAALFMAVVYMLSFVYRENIHGGKEPVFGGDMKEMLCTFSEGMEPAFLRNWVLVIAVYVAVNSVMQGIFARYVARQAVRGRS